MQGRSWMAALALAAGVALAAYAVVRGGSGSGGVDHDGPAAGVTQAAKAGDPQTRAGDEPGVVNQVYLEIVYNGFERPGCEIDVEVKPGHAGCDFKPLKLKGRVSQDGRLTLVEKQITVKSTRVDRDCSFDITVKEEGQLAKTSNRAIRLDKAKTALEVPAKSLRFYLQAPALAAREEAAKPVRR
jgi:hypothetical protein